MTTRECRAGCNGGYVWRRGTDKHDRCRACRGKGFIVESIPTSDAIADAETLRSIAEGTDEGQSVDALLKDMPTVLQQVPYYAVFTAKLAFRAIPGLRG